MSGLPISVRFRRQKLESATIFRQAEALILTPVGTP